MADMRAFEYEDGELVVDSRLVADHLGIEHESFIETLRKYQTQVEQAFGSIRFETGSKTGVKAKAGGKQPIYALLTEDQATVLMTFSRNTPEVVQCKIDLVKAFSKARELLRKRKIARATLKVYILDAPVKWIDRGRVFQEDFYRELYRLNGWRFSPGRTKHPIRVAQITIDSVYQRLQPGVWEELTKKNPKLNGRRKYCCHQFMSDNIGDPHLRGHLQGITRLMKGSCNWGQFMTFLNRFYPKTEDVQMDILFDLLAASPEDFDRWNGLVS